jgi:hypothetical protein
VGENAYRHNKSNAYLYDDAYTYATTAANTETTSNGRPAPVDFPLRGQRMQSLCFLPATLSTCRY